MIGPMADVTTRGVGEVRHRADHATLRFRYTAQAADRASALEALTTKVADVESLLADRFGVRVRSRDLAVHDRWRGRRKSGAEASRSYDVLVTDVDLLAELVAAMVSTGPASLDGPTWRLDDDAAAVREAQHLAVMEARERADGYATALGARLGKLVKISDDVADHGMPMAVAGAAAANLSELNFDPEEVEVRVACTTVWELVS